MDRLQLLKLEAFELLKRLQETTEHWYVNFSGGKDSHAVVGLHVEATELGIIKKENFTVLHSDTTIEFPLLIDLTHSTLAHLNSQGYNTKIVTAPIENRFLATLFKGYPVPNHRVRWCTDYLKIRPLNTKEMKNSLHIVGVHLGESTKRDKRINKSKTCGTAECGLDMLTDSEDLNTVSLIKNWYDCDVWDHLYTTDETVFYKGFYNKIDSVYKVSASLKTGSLRTGCIACPVIAKSTHKKNSEYSDYGCPTVLNLQLRDLYTQLSENNLRILSPKTGKLGSISYIARLYFWEQIKPINEQFRALNINLIHPNEQEYIENNLAKRWYPVTYKPDWVDYAEKEWLLNRAPDWLLAWYLRAKVFI